MIGRRMLRAGSVVALGLPLGGCIAAAIIPVAASSTGIVKTRMEAKRAERTAQRAEQAPPPPLRTEAGRRWEAELRGARIVPGATALPSPGGVAPDGAAAASTARPAGGGVPEAMQFLYGSGEGAALGVQAYAAFTRYIEGRVAAAHAGKSLRQAVIADGATLDKPYFDLCGSKPLAAVFDIDETAILNLGYEGDAVRRGAGFDEPRWERWEATGADKVVAVPGAVAAVAAARKAGVTVIFNSNRTTANAAATVAALDHAGLGPVKHGTTLWLKGDDGGGSPKDDRRWAIAAGWCVVALVGDQLGDFSDLFNAEGLAPSTRRALAASPAFADLWGNGWFMLPNPVYGPALKGRYDEIFPVDMRWSDPAGETR